ncbi:MAG TPA: hypothetical protein VKZ85_03375 [Woeseiaceae bacterium]|nr:hypothetical protein [Woeseiaceae bacterium]
MSDTITREQRVAHYAPGIRAGLLIVPLRADNKPIHDGIRPLGHRILVYPCEVELAKEESSIARPDTSEERADTGVVVATGPAVEHLAVGDIVWFGKYTGSYVAEERLVVMSETDVIAIVERYFAVRRREQDEAQRIEIARAIDQMQRRKAR